MTVFKTLAEKPWLSPGGREKPVSGVAALPAATLGLRFFFAVITVLFMLLIIAYGARMAYEDWIPGPEPKLLWLNTAFLIGSSLAMQWAWVATRRGDIDSVRQGLLAGGALAYAFLAGQVLAWRQIGSMDAFAITNPAIAFFYLITALHALHLLGGLVAWGRVMWMGRGQTDMSAIRQGIELCTAYWHFLLIVWLVLFGLLFSGNGNLEFILVLCGLR